MRAWALEAPHSSPGARAHFHLKQHTQYQSIWAHTLKVAILTSYKTNSVRYFELKIHIHTYFTSCKKEHNRSPLKHEMQHSGMVEKKPNAGCQLRQVAVKYKSCHANLLLYTKACNVCPAPGLLIGPLLWNWHWWTSLCVKVKILLTWYGILNAPLMRSCKRC